MKDSMVPWAYVLDDITATLRKKKENGGLNADPLSMREITAMADYNLARSKNLFGGLKNAFDQRREGSRNVPLHMMPDYMMWLKFAQPDIYYHLYGPDPLPKARTRDTRGLSERRMGKKVVVAERVDSNIKMPPVDEEGRIRHHHTYDQPPEHSYRVQAGGLHERRQHQIRPQKQTGERSDAEKSMAEKAAEAAEKRRRAQLS